MGELGERERQHGDQQRGSSVVPSIAARLFGPSPWASEIVSSITASEPTMATASGERAVEDRGDDEEDDHGEAGREPEQRERAAQAPEGDHQGGEGERQPEHRRAALEVDEGVAGERDPGEPPPCG